MIDQIFASDNPRVALFGLAFRAFFLFGALFSATAVMLWLAILHGQISLAPYGGGLFWHMHEMLFGFVAAIIVGFLLTAVQTWTGVKSVNGLPLFVLFLTWLLARIGFVIPSLFDPLVLAVMDVAFLLMAALFLSIPLIKVKQTRNLFFIPVLVVFALCNVLMHAGVHKGDHALMMHGAQSGILLVVVLMTVIGGRVIPMFTANGTKTARVPAKRWLDRLALGSVWLILILFLTQLSARLPTEVLAVLCFIAGISNLIRWIRWRFWITLSVTLLWPLHLAYGFIGLGLITLGYDYLIGANATSIAWHLLTVGGMGILILAMIARVSLGHTGRALSAPGWMLPAFWLIGLSALFRTVVASVFEEQALWWITVSGACWGIAYCVFFVGYFSILTRARIDNKPG